MDPSDSNRSIFSIIWSCIATLFACAWVAVHPDMPGLDDGRSHHLFHRIRVLIWVLIAPEAVLVWAWRQYRGAQALRYMFAQPSMQVYSKYWGLEHGFFLQMGGFVICPDEEDENSTFIATPEMLHELTSNDTIDFPTKVKPCDIKDKSKGDGLTHFVAISQLLWFATQCIARPAAGLSITLFELVAVSFIPTTILMHILWWRKPQNAEAPIVILVKPGKQIPYDSERYQPQGNRLFFPLSYIEQIITTFTYMLGTTHRSQSIPPGSKKVPPFYAYPHEHNPSETPIDNTPLIAVTVVGTMFGIIHILAWNFQFATRVEKLLWRVSSVIIIVIPFLTILHIFRWKQNLCNEKRVDVANNQTKRSSFACRSHRIWFNFGRAGLALGYIAARLILLGVMCFSLRALPDKQLRAIDWITDIPHIL